MVPGIPVGGNTAARSYVFASLELAFLTSTLIFSLRLECARRWHEVLKPNINRDRWSLLDVSTAVPRVASSTLSDPTYSTGPNAAKRRVGSRSTMDRAGGALFPRPYPYCGQKSVCMAGRPPDPRQKQRQAWLNAHRYNQLRRRSIRDQSISSADSLAWGDLQQQPLWVDVDLLLGRC